MSAVVAVASVQENLHHRNLRRHNKMDGLKKLVLAAPIGEAGRVPARDRPWPLRAWLRAVAVTVDKRM